MSHKINLLATAVGTVFLLSIGVTTVSAADAGGHQHQSGEHAGHGEMHSGHDHGHQCQHKMSSMDLDKDGKISKDEFIKHHELMFDKKDTNKDGFLDEAELQQMHKHKHSHDHGGQQSSGGGHAAHGEAKK